MITKVSTSVIPHQNWRGQFARGTYPDGTRSDCPPGVTTGCTPIQWPGERTTARHELDPSGEVRNWFGGLVDGMRDASGQMYMRNRYYDPATGQFTQADPIGLAGGLNAFGFAAGDPVSYSDPYGLCPYVGKERTATLTDCPIENTNLNAAFLIISRSPVGRTIRDAMIERRVDVRSVTGGACGVAQATGCQVEGENAIEVSISGTPIQTALTVVHEMMHRIAGETSATAAAHEYMAWSTELIFYKSLPASDRTDPDENQLLNHATTNGRGTLRAICLSYQFPASQCP